MREIAKAAGCSHTTIYIYFKDKDALLHELAMSPLQSLQREFAGIMQDPAFAPAVKLRRLSDAYVAFGVTHRTMYGLLFTARPNRVDEAEPVLEVQRQRVRLFDFIREAVAACLPPERAKDSEFVLALARTHFFMLHGIITSYTHSDESAEQLRGRLRETFALAVDVLLAGYAAIVKERSTHEG